MNSQSMQNMTPLARRLYKVLKDTPENDEGLHVQTLALLLQAEVNDVCKAADELIDTSWIHTTDDDYTWRVMSR